MRSSLNLILSSIIKFEILNCCSPLACEATVTTYVEFKLFPRRFLELRQSVYYDEFVQTVHPVHQFYHNYIIEKQRECVRFRIFMRILQQEFHFDIRLVLEPYEIQLKFSSDVNLQ